MIKVVVLLRAYIPGEKLGGPISSIYNLAELCNKEIEFHIITLNHDFGDDKEYKNIKKGVNLINKTNVYYLKDKEMNTKNVVKLIEKIKPHYIYQNSFFDFSFMRIALLSSKIMRIPLIVAPRGELNKNAFNIKKLKKIIYTKMMKKLLSSVLFHATSDEETVEIIKKLNINKNNVYQISNVSSQPPNDLIYHKKERNKLKIIFLSRIQTKKNLLYAIEITNKIKDKEITFDIYGPIENKDYWEKCKKEMLKSGDNIIYSYCGEVSREAVINTFSKYHLFLFPTLSENYGHVIVESLVAGCPVLLSDNTPWNDIGNYKAGKALSLNYIDDYLEYINTLAAMDENEFNEIRKNTKNYIKLKTNTEDLKQKYLSLFNN